jgi:hypothetical protein
MKPPEIGLDTAMALAMWTFVAICGGWIALTGGWLKRRFGWRYLPRTGCSLGTAIFLSAVALTSPLCLLGLMLWRSQLLPFSSFAEGSLFVCWFLAPALCLALATTLWRSKSLGLKPTEDAQQAMGCNRRQTL